MPKNRHIKLWLTLALAATMLLAASPVVADSVCSDSNMPSGLSDFCTFITESGYFNIGEVCEPLDTLDFDGLYYITVIASEADNCLEVAYPDRSTPIFSKQDPSNWGLLATIELGDAASEKNVVFNDLDAEISVALDPFCGGNCDRFRVYQLTRNSNPLSYLANPITLFSGDIIIGFNDGGGDADFNDLIVVLRPIEEPAASEPLVDMQLFTGYVPFFLLFDLKGNSYDAKCAVFNEETREYEPADPGEGTCSISTSKLESFTFDGGTLEFAPFDKPWGAHASPGCTYVRTRSGAVKVICN